nr:Protein accelerated cell death 6 [Ipomoea batatas]
MSDPKYPRLSEEESNEMENTMDPELYRATTKGDLLEFIRAMEERIPDSHHGSTADCVQLAPQKNTVLHLATIHGHDEIVKLICKDLPFFVAEKNVRGDIPLHIAARTGSSLLVALLSGADYREGCLGETNTEGNTALHEALRHHHKDVAQMLILKHPNMSYGVNKEGKSLLYLAAEAGFESIVKILMENPVGRYPIAENNKHKSPIHAAIIGRNIDVLRLLWEYDKLSFETRCEKGWNPLHYAADNGYLDGVDFLLNRCHEFGYHRDKQGFFPVHIASIRGHCNIVSMMLQRRPDSIELLTLQGQNILHVAAKGRRLKAFDYMLRMPEVERLINQRDEDGNTALHVATIYGNPKVVSSLMWDERVRLGLENGNGLTALDIAEEHMRTYIESFQKTAPKNGRLQRPGECDSAGGDAGGDGDIHSRVHNPRRLQQLQSKPRHSNNAAKSKIPRIHNLRLHSNVQRHHRGCDNDMGPVRRHKLNAGRLQASTAIAVGLAGHDVGGVHGRGVLSCQQDRLASKHRALHGLKHHRLARPAVSASLLLWPIKPSLLSLPLLLSFLSRPLCSGNLR